MKNLVKANMAGILSILAAQSAYAQESAASVYLGYVKAALLELLGYARNLGVPAKALILAALAFLAFAIYMRTRDNAGNNMRKARNLHRRAVELHRSGKEEEASRLYSEAGKYRQKAVDQQ